MDGGFNGGFEVGGSMDHHFVMLLKFRVPPRLLLKYPLSPRVTSMSDTQSACFVGFLVKIRRLQKRASPSTDTD
jgi:hypothetical protein